MECPNCGAEMLECGPYGYLAAHQSGEVLGYIYQCQNQEGFEDDCERAEYIAEHQDENEGEETVCSSAAHNGYFYTTQNGDVQTGYPC